MCDTCTVAEKIEAYGVPSDLLDEFARKVSDTTQEAVVSHLTETHELMIATLMHQTGAKELRIRGRKVKETDQKLNTGRLSLNGEETEDREEFVYTLTEDVTKPEAPEEDEFSALLRALFDA